LARQPLSHQIAKGRRHGMIEQVAARMPRMIGTGLRNQGGQDDGQQLGLVTDLGDRNDRGRRKNRSME